MAIKSANNRLIDFLTVSFAKLSKNKLEKIVRIEGGLGSQLIGLFIYETKLMNNPKVRADIPCFIRTKKTPNQVDISTWDWELDIYGYPLKLFEKDTKFYDKFLSVIDSRRAGKMQSDIRTASQIPWRQYAKSLPLAAGVHELLRTYGLEIRDEFAVIHIRRGDYLKVSNRVLSLKESIDCFVRFSKHLKIHVFISSDDIFSNEDLKYCEEAFASSSFSLVGPENDLHLVHSLMRTASFLVTSNSTFSWTAGMLNIRKNPVIISPTSFFGEVDYPINDLFRTSSPWMELKVD